MRGRGIGNGGTHPHVGLRLYEAILERHREKNILATTINAAAMVVGWRVGMVPIGYDQLPQNVWEATCCCPSQKTGVPKEENVAAIGSAGTVRAASSATNNHRNDSQRRHRHPPRGMTTIGCASGRGRFTFKRTLPFGLFSTQIIGNSPQVGGSSSIYSQVLLVWFGLRYGSLLYGSKMTTRMTDGEEVTTTTVPPAEPVAAPEAEGEAPAEEVQA